MFKALIRTQLASILASLTRSSNGKKGAKTTSLGIGLVLFGVVIIAVAIGALFLSLAEPLYSAGLGWLYFALAMLTAFALSFIGSVFMAQQQLFNARDNEQLLAMPIPPRYILGTRMLSLFALSLAFTLVVLVPAGIVWLFACSVSAAGVIIFILAALFLPLLTLTITCLFAWLLAMVTARMRNKTIITMVLYLVFLAAYFYVYMNFNNLLTALLANTDAFAGGLGSVYPVYAFGAAIANGDFALLLGFIACCVVPFLIVYIVLSRSFISVTTRRPGAKKIEYRERTLKVGSASGALFKKELRHFAANGMYILNASMGSILTIAAVVALFIYRDTLLLVVSILPESWLAAFIVIALCFLCASDVISAPSISLEGKTLWLLKSLPVTPRTILMSKVNLHLVIALPTTLLASVLCIFALPFTAAEAAAVVLLPALMSVFGALLGVVMNLRFPKFDYINETAVIKNSVSVMLTMFASWGVLAAPCVLYAVVLSGFVGITAYLYVCAALLALACAAMYVYLGRGGARRFAAL